MQKIDKLKIIKPNKSWCFNNLLLAFKTVNSRCKSLIMVFMLEPLVFDKISIENYYTIGILKSKNKLNKNIKNIKIIQGNFQKKLEKNKLKSNK